MDARARWLLWAAASLLIITVGCGGKTVSLPPTATSTPTASTPSPTAPPPTPSSSPACTPSGTALEIVAENDAVTGLPAFDSDCLAAPANATFTIAFDNREADLHNLDILDHAGGTSLFLGRVIHGPKMVTYTVDPLEAGTYYFR